MRFSRGLILLAALSATVGCSKLSGSNVGTPNSVTRFEFRNNLALLHNGMPADSLELIFADVAEAGQAGILSRARVRTADAERIRYLLGWRSDPRHQIGVKSSDDLDVTLASVLVIDREIVSVERFPLP